MSKKWTTRSNRAASKNRKEEIRYVFLKNHLEVMKNYTSRYNHTLYFVTTPSGGIVVDSEF